MTNGRFNIEIEFDHHGESVAAVDDLRDTYQGMSPGICWSPRGRLSVIVTIEAPNLAQAVRIALSLAPHEVISVDGMTTKEFDRRIDSPTVVLPPMMSPGEAAAELGITKQAVHQRITSGSLPATRVGRAWVIAAETVHALADAPAVEPAAVPTSA